MLGWLLTGCQGDGVQLDLQFPEDEQIAPAFSDIAEVSLVYWEPGRPTRRVSKVLDGELGREELASLPSGSLLRLAVELRNSNQRLVGFGRTANPIRIDGGTGRIPIEVRRPFVYLGELDGIAALDAGDDAQSSVLDEVITTQGAVQTAVPSYDGTTLALVRVNQQNGRYELLLYDTATHAPVPGFAPVLLRGAATDLALSGKGRYAIVGHGPDSAGFTGGVSIIDLAKAGAGDLTASRTVQLGAVGRLAVAAERDDIVFALVNRLSGFDCEGAPDSFVAEVSLVDASATPRTQPLGSSVQDVAASDNGDLLMVADTCGDALWRVPWPLPAGEEPLNVIKTVSEVRDVSTVAIWNDTVWTIDSREPPFYRDDEGESVLTLVSMDLDGNKIQTIPLPPLELELVSASFDDPNQSIAMTALADGVYAFDLAVAPGAGSIAVLVEGTYRTDALSSGPQLLMPPLNIQTIEYLLVDMPTLGLVQHEVSRCSIVALQSGGVFPDLRCGDAVPSTTNTLLTDGPQGISILFGSR
ncbi:hypothetical protein [Haliangium ochraceum]|uniref:Uncharacterized protein n=1 Tax=Haliangium ochraceum (strain DSM 14365 / JCM 11303 / SMP-2) TaxID=502025 RepID=D0LG52_HALO1|nr:hypothetical protein [Haliangium ochraceum]ACY18077.1 hypothetical protein Hoch_5595 [Haliangium ochraceum DSM 14365]